MSSAGPTRTQSDLADMVEMLLDKGVVVNADIVVSVGETELLGVEIRAAIASFETAAKYGLEFPEGTDMERVERAASGRESIGAETDVDGGDTDSDSDAEAEAEADTEANAGGDETSEGAPEAEAPQSETGASDHPSRRPNAVQEVDDGDED